ncbi:MAG: hypothetical protein GF332_04320 [Candidatus Moranbacteria bacterium]|nr:hypothetical protein [Candidatus Moranbacteria bacterium]
MKKINLLGFLLVFLICLPFKKAVAAGCPVCTVAVGAGIGLSRYLNIDDTISGIWIGGLMICLVYWTCLFLEKKHWTFPFYKTTVFILTYILILLPLYYANMIGVAQNKIFGLDKILFGVFCGTIVFIISSKLHFFLKKYNQNRVYFPFQKVIIPVAGLLLASVILYLLLPVFSSG